MSGLMPTFPLKMRSEAQGYLKEYFEKMLSGLTGQLGGLFYPFNTKCWEKKAFAEGGLEGWWPYEQMGYWLDGYLKCAYFANSEEHLKKARSMVENALKVVSSDGFIGAEELKEKHQGNQWPYAVFFRAVLFLYEITGEKGYLDKVRAHYLSGHSDYSEWRECVNVENIVNCYRYTKDERLKTLAIEAYRKHCASAENVETKLCDLLSDEPIRLHAVTYDEMVKIPALLYTITGEERYLQASLSGLKRIERHHLLPIGIHSGSESFGDTKATSAFETCDITDYCWALNYIASITEDVRLYDRIERIMYNVAPSVMDPYFKSLQYFSSMNQVISTHNSNHSGSFSFTPRMAYQPDHYPECCSGNCNRSMPNFYYMSLLSDADEYVFNYYLPSIYTLNDRSFEVVTDYPYRQNVRIVYHGPKMRQKIRFRRPAWCKDFSIQASAKTSFREKNGWILFDEELHDGYTFDLKIASSVEIEEVSEGYMIKREPIIYTLRIKSDIAIDKTEPRVKEGYPAYDIIPTSPWQIALDKQEALAALSYHPAEKAGLLANDDCIDTVGYYMDGVDIVHIDSSDVPVSDYDRVEYEKLKENGQVLYHGEMLFTPEIKDLAPEQLKKTKIELIPYSTAMLRWTIFPNAKTVLKKQ